MAETPLLASFSSPTAIAIHYKRNMTGRPPQISYGFRKEILWCRSAACNAYSFTIGYCVLYLYDILHAFGCEHATLCHFAKFPGVVRAPAAKNNQRITIKGPHRILPLLCRTAAHSVGLYLFNLHIC